MEHLCEAAPDVRFRLGSLEPRLITDEFCCRLRGFSNLARHFHLSLQSGCDATLRRMHRRYTTAQFFAVVERLRAAFPACSITTDVITGFPGETEQEFAQTMDFLKTCAFASMHVFPYSEAQRHACGFDAGFRAAASSRPARHAARALAAQMSQDFRGHLSARPSVSSWSTAQARRSPRTAIGISRLCSRPTPAGRAMCAAFG